MKALTFAARRQRSRDGRRHSGRRWRTGRPRRAEQLIEAVAEADEQLMELFFAEGTLTQDQLVSGLRAATVGGRLFPLVCTSGLHVIGIKGLLDAIVDYVPSPAERDFPALAKDGSDTTVKASDTAARRQRSSGRRLPTRLRAASRCCAWCRGTLKSDSTVHNLRADAPERLGHLLALQGKTQTHVPELKAAISAPSPS